MTPAPVLPSTPATPSTPAGRGKQGKHAQDVSDGMSAFGSALAMLLGGNVPGAAQGGAKAAEEQGAPAPSSGVTETVALASGVSVAGSGSLAAALSGALDGSVAATGAAAPPTSTMGAAAPGASVAGSPTTTTTSATTPGATAPLALLATGEPVAAGLRGVTPASARSAVDGGHAHAPSIGQLPGTARPARPTGSGDSGQTTDAGGGDTSGSSTTHLTPTQPTPADVPAIPPQVAAPGTTATTHSSDTTDTTVTTTVLRQVFPEVTQVATTPGTHRISITLHPESLGEVKVTVVVRTGGEVHVRLAADAGAPDGALARQALLQGAPELHRLLQGAGGDVKVVVQGGENGQPGQSRADSQSQNAAQQSQSQGQPQAQSQADDGRRRPAYPAENAQNLPPTADRTIGATTTTTARSAARPGRIDEHTGRLDRLM